MKNGKTKTGFTLVELLTVVSVILVLAAIGLPAIKGVLDSFESSGGVRNVIRLAIVRGRSIAARERRFAGVRFQQDLHGDQYMTFIVHDTPNTGLVNGFREAGGLDPVRLPDDIGVMDLMVRTDPCDVSSVEYRPISDLDLDNTVSANLVDGRNIYLTDTTSFSIVFSPTGKLVIHNVRIRNRHGKTDDSSTDNVFNTLNNINDGLALFYQDDYAERGLGQELSRNNFIIYDKRAIDSANEDSRWTDYLQHLEVLYVSPYTGQIINK